jgi:hypothetical protein
MRRPAALTLLAAVTCTTLLAAGMVAAHGEDDSLSGIRGLLGGFDVRVSSSFMHSIGAILLVGGLLKLHSHLRKVTQDEKELTRQLLACRLVWVGVAMNLIGGLMRLFEPGHPSLLEFFADRWVTVMLAKHAFVLLMAGTSIHATLESGTPSARLLSARMALASVVVIGALGALAGVISTTV